MAWWQSLLQSHTSRAVLAFESRLLHCFHCRLFANAGEELGMNRAMQSRGGRGLVAGLELVTADFHFQIVRKDSSHFRHILGLPSRLLIEIPRRDGGIHRRILHWCGILLCKHRRAPPSYWRVRPLLLVLGLVPLQGIFHTSHLLEADALLCGRCSLW